MNKSYKTVWNETTGTYVAASEVTKSHGKSSRNTKALVAALLAAGVGFGTAVKSEAAATPNSFAAGILGTNTTNSDCISSADGAVVVTNGDCSAATQQAGIVSYDGSGTAGAYFTVTDPNTAHIGAGGVDQMKITNSGVFVLNTLDMGGKKITNLANGTVSASSTDAVNGSELYGLAASDAAALGGGSSVTASGAITAPSYVVGGTTVNNVGAALSNLDGRTTTNTTNIAAMQSTVNAIASTSGTNIGIPHFRMTTSGPDSVASGQGSIAIGTNSTASGANSISVSTSASSSNASGSASIVMGAHNQAQDQWAIAIGADSTAATQASVAIGQGVKASGLASIGIGQGASVSGDYSVALGQGSSTNRAYALAVGSTAQQRQVVNVAAGTQATDAVNYGQLQAAGLKTDSSGNATNAFVAYDDTTKAAATLGGASGTTLKNVAAGAVSASSTDAVNGLQLYATNQNVAQNAAAIAQNSSDITQNTGDIAKNVGDITQNTSDIAKNASDITQNTSDIAQNTTDIGTLNTQVSSLNGEMANAVQYDTSAHDKVTLGGTAYDSATKVGGTTITNVARGVSDSDAVNMSQLNETNASVTTLGTQVTGIDGRVTQNTSDITKNTGDINTLNSQLASLGGGVAGAVAYDTAAQDKVTLVGASGTTLTNVAKGDVSASSTDAVNGSQLYETSQNVAQNAVAIMQNTSDITKNASDIEQNISDISKNAGDISQNTSDISKNAGDIAQNTSDIAQNTTNIGTLNTQVSTLNGEMADAVKYDTSAHDTVTLGGTAYDSATKVGGTTITNVARGVNDSDAVNMSQLNETNASVTTLGTQVTGIDGRVTRNTSDITKNTGDISTLNSQLASLGGGVAGAVAYDTAAQDKVTLAGASGTTLTNVAKGEVSAASADAVNGSQLYATNQNVAQNAAAIAQNTSDITKNASDIEQNISDISKNAGDIAQNTGAIAQNASDIAQNTSDIAQNTSDIGKLDTRVSTVEGSVSDLTNQLSSGTVGLVQQDQRSGDLTVAGNTGGTHVNFVGSAGPRELIGVAAGTTSNSAVNLGQLNPVVASLGGGAQVNADGSFVSPTYHMQGGTQNTVGGALDTLDTNLTSLESQINNGSIGIVTQDSTSRDILVGAATDGLRVNMAGTAGNRVVTGVAAGAVNADSVDAVNGSQLHANAASTAAALGGGSTVNADGTISAPSYSVGGTTVNNVGAAVANLDGRVTQNTSDIASLQTTVGSISGSVANAVSYDTSAHNQVTLGGAANAPKVKLTNLQDGELSATSTDAVTGAQLWNTNQQLSDLSQSVQNQQQTGNNAMSLNAGSGPAAAATGTNAMALGGGSQASGDNSVAIGSGSVADEANTVSVGSQGNERRITNVAPGKTATDAVNLGQMQSAIGDTARAAYSGVAAATALTMIPEVDAGKTLAVGVAGATYKGYQAAAVGASARITPNLKVKVGAGISGSETTVGAGASYQW
ncbi:YadA-like family protein [Paraburkholderia fungorum]|uniref:YadA-like family protein n=1 Tax=Paraburkholderia fungorum TaxID=134537 RepID=UPI0038BE0EFD